MGNNYHIPWADGTTSFTVASMNPAIASLDAAITYHKGAIVGCDGTLSWTAGTLTWSGALHIYFTSAAGNAVHNSINAGNIALNDAEFAYVTLSETNNAVLTVAKAAIGAGSASNFKAYNRLILGYRNAADDKFYPVALAGIFTQNAAQAHAASHAVSGADTVFPDNPNADRFLMWDDDPGQLVWAEVASGGDMLKATYDTDNDGIVDNSEKLEGSTKAQVQDHAPKAHTASHAVSGADTVFPADPNADRFLMWDDDPGQLVWAEADVTNAVNIASSIHGVSEKETPVDNDEIGLIDSAASNVLKKTLWSKIKTTLKTYFDSIYMPAKEQSIVCADSITIDWSAGATAYMTFDRASVAVTLSNPVGGQVYRFLVKQDGTGGRALTWTTTVKWRGGSAPTLTATANAVDILTLVYINSGWYGDIAKAFA